ncbi:Carboxylate-amine ligase YbdK [Pseudoruegeria aquimaris]|uniref:Putative glutamate--cysteine ligase 2 n=1 Tax=Pseudoruegeria aquimaris TaxID=393663 RepID=A0A1Y5R9T5_9RHOB|nr:carboxylate-amine ligase [Pseudoruegeria aquimaris]SLN11303.1 Carboxylate-amine ligase YbdK [Pseudoruegeria aquimaris]
MTQTPPSFTIGIEEEYLLVDRESLSLAEAPEAMMAECVSALDGQVSPEYLQCQIEIGTKVCHDITQARADLKRLRGTVARIAARHGLAPIAASCHPFADWKQQHHTDKARYNDLERDLAGVVRRMLICGMHVHVCVENPDLRIDLMNQLTYFLPHLLALSASSPYWNGQDTGLASYRLTVFDNLPRTGLPQRLGSFAEYERSVQALVDLGLIEDASKIWWDLRPSSHFPTLESRICDVSPRLEDALSLAAATQCLTRMLYRLSRDNQRWRIYENFLVGENRWRAQRYGAAGAGLIDFGKREITSMADLVEELIDLTAPDAAALGCTAEVEGLRRIIVDGTSAQRQRAAYARSRDAGQSHEDALKTIVEHLIEEFHADL